MIRQRTIRLDISPSIYEQLEIKAMEEDAGIHDFIRSILMSYLRNSKDPGPNRDTTMV